MRSRTRAAFCVSAESVFFIDGIPGMKDLKMQQERREAYYSGRVQGVGFRFTVRRIAADLDVAGFVRNLPDGRVQVVAEGNPEELDGLLAEIADAMQSNIGDTDVSREPATGEFSGFTIRY